MGLGAMWSSSDRPAHCSAPLFVLLLFYLSFRSPSVRSC